VDAVDRARDWLAESFHPRHVVLSSPHPLQECCARLAAVTTPRIRDRYYLDPRTAGRADPLLTGAVGATWVRVGLFRTSPRGFKPVLKCRVEQASGGGTILTGTVGPGSAPSALLPVLLVASAIAFMGVVAAGCVQLALGHARGIFLFFGALIIPVLCMGLIVAGRKQVEREVPMLLEQVNQVLESAAEPGGRPSASPTPRWP
jgi:hypothetical protein